MSTMESEDESFYEIKARTIAILSNPKRLQIVDLLADRERSVSELAVALSLPQATTSQHLAVMRKAGVVDARKDGNHVYYRLADPRIAAACRVMSEAILGFLLSQQERLRPVLLVAQKQRHG